MKNILQRHRDKIKAERAAGNEGKGGKVIAAMPSPRAGLVGASQTAALLDRALAEDLAALKGLASIERKVEFKRATLIPRYREQVKRLMAEGKRHEAISYLMVWLFDAGDIEEALKVAAWCAEHDQPMPERFKSSVRFFAASQVLEWAGVEFKKGQGFEPYLGQALALIEAPDGEPLVDVDDELRGGFHRLYGLDAVKAEDWPQAVERLEKAAGLGLKVGSYLEKAQKKFDKLTAPPGGEGGE